MEADKMKLTDMEEAVNTIPFNKYVIQHEWRMDPPPFLIRRLPDDILVDLHRVKLQGLAEVSKLMGEINQVESRMYSESAELMAKFK